MHKIALIEDQASIRQYVVEVLKPLANVTPFERVSEFQKYMEAHGEKAFDLVLSDLYLPGEDGRDVLRFLIEKGTPIIIITGDQDVSTESEMLSLGAFDFIRKPLNPDILIHRVGLHLKLREEQSRVEQTQDQLIQSEKLAALGQLAAGVAHEINNPIGFVTSNSNLIKKYMEKLSKALTELEAQAAQEVSGEALLMFTRWKASSKIENIMKDLTEISTESIEGLDRVKDIVKDLKEYAHQGEIKFEPTDLNKSLKSTINLLRNEIKYKAEVVENFGELPLVPAISSQLNQVLVNIIVNACHAIPEFGEITVESAVEKGNAVLRIRDNGVGMPKQVIRKIFDPFFTTKPVGKGTGIGLAITKSIVDRHHGELKVISEEGIGTTFEIYLPLEHEEHEQFA